MIRALLFPRAQNVFGKIALAQILPDHIVGIIAVLHGEPRGGDTVGELDPVELVIA